MVKPKSVGERILAKSMEVRDKLIKDSGGLKKKASQRKVKSPFPLPATKRAILVRGNVWACNGAGCKEVLEPERIHPLAETFLQCKLCKVLLCRSCSVTHPKTHPTNWVMNCMNCGVLHIPVESKCDALWCTLCGAQYHTGDCNARMASCDHCGTYCDHETATCPLSRAPTPVGDKTTNMSFTVKHSAPLPQTRKLLDVLLNGPADTPPPPTTHQVKAIKHKLKPSWVLCADCDSPGHLMCGSTGAARPASRPWDIEKEQCMKCFESGHTTTTCTSIKNRTTFTP